MRNERRYKLEIGLTLALAATALGGTNALAFPAPVDTTAASDATSILPPLPGTPTCSYPYPVNRTVIVRSPENGRNARVPAF
jgi:hypothetical protein